MALTASLAAPHERVRPLAIVQELPGGARVPSARAAFRRLRTRRQATRDELDAYVAGRPAPLTVLVPSSDDLDAVRRTLWSAALQEYPDLRVVVLLDDPPGPPRPETADGLAHIRALTDEVAARLDTPRVRVDAARTTFESTVAAHERLGSEAVEAVVDLCLWAAGWLAALEAEEGSQLGGLAEDLARTGRELHGARADESHLRALYRRLSHVFGAELSTFEPRRHLYRTDSPGPVDAYLALVGRSFRTEESIAGRVLVASSAEDADVVVPQADITLSVEGGSSLPREYCLRLGRTLQRSRRGTATTRHATYRGDGTALRG
jgi:hypothetical protein